MTPTRGVLLLLVLLLLSSLISVSLGFVVPLEVEVLRHGGQSLGYLIEVDGVEEANGRYNKALSNSNPTTYCEVLLWHLVAAHGLAQWLKDLSLDLVVDITPHEAVNLPMVGDRDKRISFGSVLLQDLPHILCALLEGFVRWHGRKAIDNGLVSCVLLGGSCNSLSLVLGCCSSDCGHSVGLLQVGRCLVSCSTVLLGLKLCLQTLDFLLQIRLSAESQLRHSLVLECQNLIGFGNLVLKGVVCLLQLGMPFLLRLDLEVLRCLPLDARQFLGDTSLHIEIPCKQRLHGSTVIRVQLDGLARLMIEEVCNDMDVVVTVELAKLDMPLVSMDVDADHVHTFALEPLNEGTEIIDLRLWFDWRHSLTDRRSSGNDFLFAGFRILSDSFLGLHGTTSLLLDLDLHLFEEVREGDTSIGRVYPGLIEVSVLVEKVSTSVLVFNGSTILGISSVVRFACPDIAGTKFDACLHIA